MSAPKGADRLLNLVTSPLADQDPAAYKVALAAIAGDEALDLEVRMAAAGMLEQFQVMERHKAFCAALDQLSRRLATEGAANIHERSGHMRRDLKRLLTEINHLRASVDLPELGWIEAGFPAHMLEDDDAS